MAPFTLTKLNLDLLGPRLEKLVTNFERLCEVDSQTREAVSQAKDAVPLARQADVLQMADAAREGKPKPKATREVKALDALHDKERDLQVIDVAVRQARDEILTDLAENSEAYTEKLQADADATTQAAVKALTELDAELGRLAEQRAHINWLTKPTKGEDFIDPWKGDVFAEVKAVERPDGSFPAARDLTLAVRQALLGEKAPNTQAEWGIPGIQVPDDGLAGNPTKHVSSLLAERDEEDNVYVDENHQPGRAPDSDPFRIEQMPRTAAIHGQAAQVFAEQATGSDGGRDD